MSDTHSRSCDPFPRQAVKETDSFYWLLKRNGTDVCQIPFPCGKKEEEVTFLIRRWLSSDK